jgi:hypothetical protein
MAFKPVKKFTSNKQSYEDVRILLPESGATLVSAYLKDKNNTVIRMLPAFDENGKEEVTLNPDGSSDAKEEALGQAFVSLEICNFYKGGRHSFISNVKEEDREGRPAPGGQSPAHKFMRRLRYKLWEQITKKERGYKLDVPEHWLAWHENNIVTDPQVQYAVQCMAKEINGEIRLNMKKEAEWIAPAVFLIPSSAFKTFSPKITERRDPNKPLSLTNNRFGDFCSCSGGHLLRLVKYVTKVGKQGMGSGTVYDLLLDDPCPLDVETAAQYVRPWEEILNIPTVEDTIEILANCFEPVALDFAFRGTPYHRYLDATYAGLADTIAEALKPEEIKGMPVNRRTAPMAAAKPKAPVVEPVEEDNLNFDSDDTDNPAEEMVEPSDMDKDKYAQHLKNLLAKQR